MKKNPRGCLSLAASLAFAALCTLPRAGMAETRWYAVGMNLIATYSDGKFGPGTNCPNGGNHEWVDEQLRILEWRYNYSPEKAKQVLLDTGVGQLAPSLINERGVKDGKPASIYWYPLSIPKHPDEIVVPHGRGYGFDLDGKAASRPDALWDPETHQYVENNLFRMLGCYALYNMNLPERPPLEETNYVVGLSVVPPLLISITGTDLSHDGPVTVTFAKALQHPFVGADGKPLRGQTYTLDPSTERNFGTLHGKIENGELTASGGEVSWVGETPLLTVLDLTNTHLRLKTNPDGSLGGYLGGFEPWMDYWFQESAAEEFSGVDVSTMYYNCLEMADADPDPVTGKNRRVSATFRLDDIEPVYAIAQPLNYRPPANLRSQNLEVISRYLRGGGYGPTYPRTADR